MADEAQYSSDTTMPNKRNYDDQTMTLSSGPRGPTGFSSGPPIPAPDSAAAPPSYNNVPPPVDDFRAAKRRAEQIAARLLNSAPADAKRPRVDNGSGAFDSTDKGFSSPPSDVKPSPVPSAIPVSNGGFQDGIGTSKKIEIPNIRVGVIIGKGGETIKYLQLQSGAKIQVTRDMEADLGSPTRMVELMGTPEQITKAEQLINDVLAEAETGGSGIIARRLTGQAGSESFVMKIPNNKVGLVIGKGGETIKNMQARTGARIQVIPLHLPPGDTLTGRTVQIDGSSEQIESAKQLVNEVIIENRLRNPAMAGGYSQQGYQAPPHTNWGTLGAPPMQQPGYGYVQPGAYPGPSPQYNMSQPSYAVYPSQSTSGGYSANWDQSSVPPSQQTSQGSGYDYYSQQPTSQQPPAPGGSAAPAGNFGYNYNQPAASGYNQQGQGHSQDGYGGYHVPPSGYGQPSSYDQQQGYNSASSYGNVTNSTQEGHTPSYGTGDSTQAPAPAQGYGTSQQPSPNPASYPPQGAAQPGYVVPPSQGGYGNQAPVQSAYPIYGPPQGQKPNPPAYVQTQQSPTAAGGYGQPAPVQPGYPHSQPPSTGYSQPDSDSQRAPPSSYGGPAQQGYGGYGAPPVSQPGYGQGPPSYNSYGGGYPQYSADGNAAAPASQPVQQSVVSKSPQS